MSEFIDKVFDKDGLMDHMMEGYSVRISQKEAAEKIEKILSNNESKNLILEAGCGFGKTLTYLLPILKDIVLSNNSKKVVIATANISLQEQLVFKDIPFAINVIKKIFKDASLKVTLFKGRQNFLCNKKLEDSIQDSLITLDKQKEEEMNKIIEWYKDDKCLGDLSHLSFVPSVDTLRQISCLDSDECLHRRCNQYDNCFHAKHKEDLNSSNIIVTNYAMLFSDIKTGGKILPEYDYIIFDEAHEAPNICRNFLASKMNFNIMIKFKNRIVEINNLSNSIFDRPILFDDLVKNDNFLLKYSQLFSVLKENLKLSAKGNSTMIFEDINLDKISKSLIDECLFELSSMNNSVDDELEAKINRWIYAAQIPEDSEEENNANKMRNKIKSLKESMEEFVLILEEFKNCDKCLKDVVSWVGVSGKNEEVEISRMPVDVGPYMKKHFYDTNKKCFFISATLSVSSDFEYFKNQIGLELVDNNNISTYIGESPFDMHEQQLWYLPDDAIEGNKKEFNDNIFKHISEIVTATNGGVLCLFTSNSNMLNAYNKAMLEIGHMFKILKQGDMPKIKLINAFRDDKNSVLFATKSFFTGIDVRGESLRCLVIDKLPFPQPSDPLQQKMRNEKNSFYKFSIPEMIINLKQAIGRGVRSKDDKCVIAFLDNRMATAKYKTKINSSFNYKKNATRNLNTVSGFVKNYIGDFTIQNYFFERE